MSGAHAAPRRLSRLLLVAPLILVLTGTGSWALWRQVLETESNLRSGYVHFAVGDPTPGGGALASPFQTQWRMPNIGLGTPADPLAPGERFARAVQLDAVAQGNRGLAFTLDGVTIADPTGVGQLAASLSVAALMVPDPASCVPAATQGADLLYSGDLADAEIPATELVAAKYDEQAYSDPDSAYLCLVFERTVLGTYTNTATVTGTPTDPLDLAPDVTASSEWHAVVELDPPAGAFTPDVRLTFGYETFRPGGAP